MIRDPEPTEVIPTITPPTIPIRSVGRRFRMNGPGSAVLHHRTVAQTLQDEQPGEGEWDGPCREPPNQRPVDGAATKMDAGSDGLHDHGRDEVAGDSRERLDLEQDDEDGSHECAAAHARQADREADQQTRKSDEEIDVQLLKPRSHTTPSSTDSTEDVRTIKREPSGEARLRGRRSATSPTPEVLPPPGLPG